MDINQIPLEIIKLSVEICANIDKLDDINLIYSASEAMEQCKLFAEQTKQK